MYKLLKEGILRIKDGAVIPIDEKNPDYQEFMLWQEKGNKALPLAEKTQEQTDEEKIIAETQRLYDEKNKKEWEELKVQAKINLGIK